MLILETIAKIRRAFFVQGKSIKLICRELSVSRKVVRKVIRSDATEFRYEREAQPLPKIGPWTDQLDELLLANEGKAARERLTLIRLFEKLRGRGYGGGYDVVRRYVIAFFRCCPMKMLFKFCAGGLESTLITRYSPHLSRTVRRRKAGTESP